MAARKAAVRTPSRPRALKVEALESRWTPAAGDLDTTFGNGGKVLTDFAASLDYGADMALQADGKIVVAGAQIVGDPFAPTAQDIAVARYNADGSLDMTFGTGGKVTTDYGTDTADFGRGVVIQLDGKIVVVGDSTSDSGFAVLRYDTDGTPDANFGTNGRVVTGFVSATSRIAYDVTIDGSGKIVVVGGNFHSVQNVDSMAVARFNTDGSPDTDFGTNGIALITFGTSTQNVGRSVAIDGQGRIVVGGSTSVPVGEFETDDDMAVARLLSDGTLDPNFGSGGKTTLAFGTSLDVINSVTVDDTDRVLAAGYSHRTNGFDMAVVRYKEDGTLDPTFDTDGKLRVTFTGFGSDAHAVRLDGSGRIVVAGPSDSGFAVARLDSNGEADTTFSSDGKVVTGFGSGFAGAEAVAFDTDGRLVVGGTYSPNQTSADFALARYLTTGGGGGGGGGTAAIVGGDLVVQGTTENDTFKVRPAQVAGQIEVMSGRTSLGQFAIADVTGKVVLRGLDGDDKLALSPKVTLPAELDGGVGNDMLTGGAGKDTLIGGAGNDKMAGGANDDVYPFADAWGVDKVIESGLGIDRVDFSGVAADLVFTQMGAARTADAANTLAVAGKVESLVGGAANDKLTSVGSSTWSLGGPNTGTVRTLAFTGVESLVGGAGLDRLVVSPAGTLSGTFDGGRGKNTLDYAAFATAITVNLKAGTATGLGGVANVADVIGGAGDDLIVGGDGVNSLTGGAGRDILIGGALADRLQGGDGDDLLVAGLVSFATDPTKLAEVRAEWTSANDYTVRVTNLTQGGGANGTTVLAVATVTDDAKVDQLTGGAGADWFVTNAKDRVRDGEVGETTTLI